MFNSWRRVLKSIRTPSSFKPRLEVFEDRMVPSTFTVTNLLDSGKGSLRAAIASANADKSVDTIAFAANLKGEIVLIGGELSITNSVKLSVRGLVSSPSAATTSAAFSKSPPA